ncbi:MAG: hypothetical protein Q9187_009573, partial [Circinaria calcarea]
VAASTPSPTIDPSIRTILIGHSMGGIVAADTLLAIVSEPPVPPATSFKGTASESKSPSPPPSPQPFMFPYIQGVLAFDTPYLGIAPGVVAHGAETHYKTASTAYAALSEVAGVFGWGAGASPSKQQAPHPQQKALPVGPEAAKEAVAASVTASSNSHVDAAAIPAWQKWGKYAMFAGAAGAVAAGGAAAYLKRDTITEGWTWVGSHLEFVGCLMRGEELKSRLQQITTLEKTRQIGFADLVTVLGRGAFQPADKTVVGGFVEIGGVGKEDKRTFCSMPRSKELQKYFEGMVNEKATDETVAHMSMFTPRDNPGYYAMSERAKELVVG